MKGTNSIQCFNLSLSTFYFVFYFFLLYFIKKIHYHFFKLDLKFGANDTPSIHVTCS